MLISVFLLNFVLLSILALLLPFEVLSDFVLLSIFVPLLIFLSDFDSIEDDFGSGGNFSDESG